MFKNIWFGFLITPRPHFVIVVVEMCVVQFLILFTVSSLYQTASNTDNTVPNKWKKKNNKY